MAGTIELPPIPGYAFTALGEVPVLFVERVNPKEKDTAYTLGFADFHARTIQIRVDLALAAKWHTYFHEAAHFLLWDAGVKLGDRMEEAVCDAIATYRFQEMVTRR